MANFPTAKSQADVPFKKGDRVWFVSKFGDRVSGIYEEPAERDGSSGHLVISDNAFGPDSKLRGVRCLVFGALHHDRGRRPIDRFCAALGRLTVKHLLIALALIASIASAPALAEPTCHQHAGVTHCH